MNPWIADLEGGAGWVGFFRWLFPAMPAAAAEQASAAQLASTPRARSVALLRGLAALTPPAERIAASRVPVLIAAGTGDPLLVNGRALAARWPGARLLEVPGADHAGVIARPEVLAAVRALLRQPSAPGARWPARTRVCAHALGSKCCPLESSRSSGERDLKTVLPTHLAGRVSVERAVRAIRAARAPFQARVAIAGKDARTLARDLLAMSQEELSAAFKGSPMKRAKLRGLKRNAAVVLGNVGTSEDVDVLTRALDAEPLVREHAAWAVRRIRAALRPDRNPDAGDEVGEPGVLP